MTLGLVLLATWLVASPVAAAGLHLVRTRTRVHIDQPIRTLSTAQQLGDRETLAA